MAKSYEKTNQNQKILYLPAGSDSKEPAWNVGDLGSIPGSGRPLLEGDHYLLQHSWLENSVGRGAWQARVHGAAKSQTEPSNFLSVFSLFL